MVVHRMNLLKKTTPFLIVGLSGQKLALPFNLKTLI
jgi:hypothetical protein